MAGRLAVVAPKPSDRPQTKRMQILLDHQLISHIGLQTRGQPWVVRLYPSNYLSSVSEIISPRVT